MLSDFSTHLAFASIVFVVVARVVQHILSFRFTFRSRSPAYFVSLKTYRRTIQYDDFILINPKNRHKKWEQRRERRRCCVQHGVHVQMEKHKNGWAQERRTKHKIQTWKLVFAVFLIGRGVCAKSGWRNEKKFLLLPFPPPRLRVQQLKVRTESNSTIA